MLGLDQTETHVHELEEVPLHCKVVDHLVLIELHYTLSTPDFQVQDVVMRQNSLIQNFLWTHLTLFEKLSKV